jgi:hypothetical protein
LHWPGSSVLHAEFAQKKVLHAESSRKSRMKMHSRGDGSDGDYYGPLKKKMENTMVETKKNARIL